MNELYKLYKDTMEELERVEDMSTPSDRIKEYEEYQKELNWASILTEEGVHSTEEPLIAGSIIYRDVPMGELYDLGPKTIDQILTENYSEEVDDLWHVKGEIMYQKKTYKKSQARLK